MGSATGVVEFRSKLFRKILVQENLSWRRGIRIPAGIAVNAHEFAAPGDIQREGATKTSEPRLVQDTALSFNFDDLHTTTKGFQNDF
jgi:hypothetical protein